MSRFITFWIIPSIQGLSLHLGPPSLLLGWVTSSPEGFFCLPSLPHSTGVIGPCLASHMSAGNLNSGLHASASSSFTSGSISLAFGVVASERWAVGSLPLMRASSVGMVTLAKSQMVA